MYVIIYAYQCVNQSNMTGPHVLIINLHLWKDSKLLKIYKFLTQKVNEAWYMDCYKIVYMCK